jgi:hypothetical protein
MTPDDMDPSPLTAVIPEAVNNLTTRAPGQSLVQRLRSKYGLGNNPAKRMALYRKIERLVEQHGDRAYQVVAEANAQAHGLQYADRYFCKTVVCKFKELGWWNPARPL